MEDRFIIDNYQIIKHGELFIRPGITLITGPSNNGKSSIFKAYKQIIYNLSGNTYINSFADKCKLTLENDIYKIAYTKEKSKSSYDITVDGKTSHIDKLGVNQLDRVKELTAIDKDLGYNFWDQLEKPFLLNRTNREQFLLLQESPISSNLLNIQEIIKADIKNLRDDTLVAQGSLDVLTGTIAKQEEILKHSDLVHEVSSKASDLNTLNNKLSKIMEKVRTFSATEKELESYKDISDITFTNDTDTIYEKFSSIEKKVKEFTRANIDCVEIDKSINELDTEVSNIKKVMSEAFQVCPLCGNMLSENHSS